MPGVSPPAPNGVVAFPGVCAPGVCGFPGVLAPIPSGVVGPPGVRAIPGVWACCWEG